MIDEQKLRELAEDMISLSKNGLLEIEDVKDAPAAILALLDELATLRQERTAWRVTAENAERELAAIRVSLGEPVAEIIMSDDDFDMGLTDDYAFGRKTLMNGTHQLYALSNKETP